MRKVILSLFLLCVSCTKPLGDNDLLNQPSTEPPGAFNIATIQRFDQQLLVSWSSSKGAKSYELKYGTTAGTYTQFLKADKSPAVVTGLTPETTYYFRVTASNDLGTVDSTSEKSYNYMGAPGEFLLTTALAGNGEVILSWDASPEASSYTVMYGTSVGDLSTSAGTTLLTAKTISTLNNNTTYHFSVIAKNSVGQIASSNTLSATPVPPPSAPLNPVTTADTNKCTIAWDAPATGTPLVYVVRRLTSPTTDVLACSSPAPAQFCEDIGLAPGTYEYTVEATNASGTSPKSSTVSCAVGLPGSFQMLTATPNNGTVALTWNSSNLATAYTVRYGTEIGNISTVASVAANSPYTVTGLTNMVPYFFSVTATNPVGTKLADNTLTATPNVPPTVPTNPVVTVPDIGKCSLEWMPPASGSPPITYTVRRVVNPSVSVVICEGISTRTCFEEGLSGGTYNYTIEAINSVGTGPATGTIPCSLGAPVATSTPAATIGNKKVTLTWTGGSGANSFTVKYGTINPPADIASTTATSPFIVENLNNGTLYYFRVDGVNAYGSTPSGVRSGTPISTKPNVTVQGPPITMNNAFVGVTLGDTYTRKFNIADPDPEDTIDCAGNVTATSTNPGVIPHGNITVGGAGLACSLAIASDPGTYGQAGIVLNTTDGSATQTLNISIQALPTPTRIYSWRKRGGYGGPALKVRRISDNNTTDISFDAHGLVDPYLTTFAGSTGRLVTWYDQGSQGKHAYQNDPNRQPIVRLTNGILQIIADGTNDSLIVPDFPTHSPMTVYTHFTYASQGNVHASLLSFGKKEALGLEGFEIGRTDTGYWKVSSADTATTTETTSGPSLASAGPGQALILNTSGPLKRNLITSTTNTATPVTSTGPLTGYVPSTNTDAYLFSGGSDGSLLPINGTLRELLIFNHELSDSDIKALTIQN